MKGAKFLNGNIVSVHSSLPITRCYDALAKSFINLQHHVKLFDNNPEIKTFLYRPLNIGIIYEFEI